MFARKYKEELTKVALEIENDIIEHWRLHKSPYWTHLYKSSYNKKVATNYEEISVAITWIMQGAKGCSCYNESLLLQNKTANLLRQWGAIEACENIIQEELGTLDPEADIIIKKPRKLLIKLGV